MPDVTLEGPVGLRFRTENVRNLERDQDKIIDLLRFIPAEDGGKREAWMTRPNAGPDNMCPRGLADAIWDFQSLWKFRGLFQVVDGVADPGRTTIAHLNRLVSDWEKRKGLKPLPSPPPAPSARARFTALDRLQGFDPTPLNPSVPGEAFQALPVGSKTATVRLVGGDSETAVNLDVTLSGFGSRPATGVVFTELTARDKPTRPFRLRSGATTGGAVLTASNPDGSVAGRLQIAVLPRKSLSVRFYILSDTSGELGHRAKAISRAEIPEFARVADRIWSQANIGVTYAGTHDFVFKGDAGDVVDAYQVVLQFGDQKQAEMTPADRHVIFVWELSDKAKKKVRGETPFKGPVICLHHILHPPSSIFAHELGHSLQLEHKHARGDPENLMNDPIVGQPTLLNRDQILFVNPP